MRHLLLIIMLFSLLSCETTTVKSIQTNAAPASTVKKLLPYFDIYQYGHTGDTILTNGTYIKYLANADTSDTNLYIKYGNRDFDSILVWEVGGVPTTSCKTPDLFYATDKYVSLCYACMNSRGMVLLPLNKKEPVEHFTPIFIDTSRKILLFEDYQKYKNDECFDTLTISDFDFKRQKLFVISHIVCGNRIGCIDTVYIKGNNLFLKSSASTPCDNLHDAGEKFEHTIISWIK